MINNVTSVKSNGNRFQITWTTNEPTTGMIFFTCCGDMNDDALDTSHSVMFRGGKGTRYEFWVTATDAAGNETTDGPFYYQN